VLLLYLVRDQRRLQSLPTRRSSDLVVREPLELRARDRGTAGDCCSFRTKSADCKFGGGSSNCFLVVATAYTSEGGSLEGRFEFRSEEHTSELQSRENLVCRLLLEKK